MRGSVTQYLFSVPLPYPLVDVNTIRQEYCDQVDTERLKSLYGFDLLYKKKKEIHGDISEAQITLKNGAQPTVADNLWFSLGAFYLNAYRDFLSDKEATQAISDFKILKGYKKVDVEIDSKKISGTPRDSDLAGSIDSAKAKCIELGFSEKSPKLGECVLKLLSK